MSHRPPHIDSDDISGFMSGMPEVATPNFSDITPLHDSPHSFARLYRAKRHGKWVVLKVLKPGFDTNPELIALQRKEFDLAYTLEHPNIARVLDFTEVEGLGQCIVMEWIDGITLREFIDRGRFDEAAAVKVLQGVVSALDYIHSRQMIHRDVKPDNIMIANIGATPKLIDFGLSDASTFHILKRPAGSPRYMPPEATGEGPVDERADIYAVGVIAREMHHALGDKSGRLRRIATLCADPDPERRPRDYSGIPWGDKRGFKPVTLIAAIGVLALAAAVTLIIANDWSTARSEASTQALVTTDTQTTHEPARTDNGLPTSAEATPLPHDPSTPTATEPQSQAAAQTTSPATTSTVDNAPAPAEAEPKQAGSPRAQAAVREKIKGITRRNFVQAYNAATEQFTVKGAPLTLDEARAHIKVFNDNSLAQIRKYYDTGSTELAESGYIWTDVIQIAIEMLSTEMTRSSDLHWEEITEPKAIR